MKSKQVFLWVLMPVLLVSLTGCGLGESLAATAKGKKKTGSSGNPCGGAPGTCPNPGSTQCCSHWAAAEAHWRACVQYHNAGNASAARNAAQAYQNQKKRAQGVCRSLRSVAVPTLRGAAPGPRYVARDQIDTLAADGVTAFDAQALSALGGGPQLGVDSSGRAYVVAATLDDAFALHQVVLGFTTGASPTALLEPVLRATASEELIRALLVVAEETTDAAGNPVLVRDHLLLIVDGYDHAADRSWREMRLVNPEAPGASTVLYRRDPEPARGPSRAVGQMRATLAGDGTIYVLEEGDSSVSLPGGIRAFAWSDEARAYIERPQPVMSAGTMTGAIAAGPDGYLYGFARRDAHSDVADQLVRIDPSGTDAWTSYRPFADGLEKPRGPQTDLAFDSEGDLFLSASVWSDGSTLRNAVLPVSTRDVIGGGAIASTGSTPLLPGMLASGVDGSLYVIERRFDAAPPAADLDVVLELMPRR